MFRALRLNDPALFALALAATLMGLFFIFDAGYARSLKDGYGWLPRESVSQVVLLGPALILGAAAARIRPEAWKRWSKVLWVVALLSLLLPMIPGIGVEMNGAKRWVKVFGPITFQPAEFAKVAVIVYLAGVFAGRAAWPSKAKPQKSAALWMDNILIPKLMRCMPALWVLAAIVLVEKEPDLGTAAVMAAVAGAMFYLGGVSRKSFAVLALLGFVGVVFLIKQEPYRLQRILSHSSRWSSDNIDDIGFQTVQAEMAQASGSLLGTGAGSGRAKHLLPAATTDFMPATIGEEFGFVGMTLAVGTLALLAFRLFKLAPTAPTPFGAMILNGVGWWITIQTSVNVMMANGFLPPIGIPLPFLSSGGSSLIALWLAIGLCQSALTPAPAKEASDAPDRYRWGDGRARLSRA